MVTVASIVLSTLAIFRLTARVSVTEMEVCQLYAQLHVAAPPRC